MATPIYRSIFSRSFVITYLVKLIVVFLVSSVFVFIYSISEDSLKTGALIVTVMGFVFLTGLIYHFFNYHFKHIGLFNDGFIVVYKFKKPQTYLYTDVMKLYFTSDSLEDREQNLRGEVIFHLDFKNGKHLEIQASEYLDFKILTKNLISAVNKGQADSHVERF